MINLEKLWPTGWSNLWIYQHLDGADADVADDADDADDADYADDDLIILKDCWSIPTPHHPHL